MVDDYADLLELARILIERLCDQTAVTAKSMHDVVTLGERALDCDMALLDVNLGDNEPNGVDIYRWLRSHQFKGPIYFLTGHAATMPMVAEATRLGDTQVLRKPVDPSVLIRIIRGENA